MTANPRDCYLRAVKLNDAGISALEKLDFGKAHNAFRDALRLLKKHIDSTERQQSLPNATNSYTDGLRYRAMSLESTRSNEVFLSIQPTDFGDRGPHREPGFESAIVMYNLGCACFLHAQVCNTSSSASQMRERAIRVFGISLSILHTSTATVLRTDVDCLQRVKELEILFLTCKFDLLMEEDRYSEARRVYQQLITLEQAPTHTGEADRLELFLAKHLPPVAAAAA